MLRLKGKTAIITGGSGGLGKETAKLFAKEGAQVAIVGNNEKEIINATREFNEDGQKVVPLIGDVSDQAFVIDAIEEVYQAFGGITTIVNSAGIMKNCSIEEETVDNWDQHINVNVKGMMLISKHAFPLLKRNETSSIINTSSIMAYTSATSSVSYTVSKSAILGLTRSLALEGAPYQIRVNAICPGTIDTPMYRSFIDQQESPIEAHQKFNQMFPLGRVGTPKDVANLNLFFASDESSYITGADFVIDGGFLIKGTNDE